MAHLNFKSLFAKIDKSLKAIQEEPVLVLIDCWNTLANCCDSESPELDFLESFNDLLLMAERNKVSVAIGVNRDLFDGAETPYYREAKSVGFEVVFEI
jgi:hypothetical protein